MRKQYHFSSVYVYLLTSLLGISLLAEYLSPTVSGLTDRGLLTSLAFYTLIFIILRFTSCMVTSTEFIRFSPVAFRKRIPIADIAEMTFPSSWIVTPQARTLVVWDKNNHSIMMTDMAYGRPALADVVKTLLEINPRIKIDKDVRALLSDLDKNSKPVA